MVGKRITAFTLVELLVVIAIIGVLISLLVPSLARARDAGRNVLCLNNEKQMYLANSLYSDDNKENVIPWQDRTQYIGSTGSSDWAFLMMPYLGFPGSALDYWRSPRQNGILEIRGAVSLAPWGGGSMPSFTYKTSADTSTKKNNVMFCPNTVGAFTWPSSGLYSGHTGSLAAFYDYGPNTFVTGTIGNDGKFVTGGGYPLMHLRWTGPLRTRTSKLALIGDGFGYGVRINNTPANRHNNITGDNTEATAKINIVFVDGHGEMTPRLVSSQPIWNTSNTESTLGGSQYYVYGY